jgi:sporulation protein YlmC with PRC-barrel domain
MNTRRRIILSALLAGLTAITQSLSAQNQPSSGKSQAPSAQNRQLSTQSQPTSGQNSSSVGQMARADRVYGNEVISSDNQKLGLLNNLMVDLESGRILYGVIGEASGQHTTRQQRIASQRAKSPN